MVPEKMHEQRLARRAFLRIAASGVLALGAVPVFGCARAIENASLDSRSAAAQWLERQRRRVSKRDFDLLRRAQDVLYENFFVPGEGEKPLPWAPLRGICPARGKYPGVWDWDGSLHALAVSQWDGDLAREQLQIILERQQPSGLLVNNVRANGEIRTRYGGPPLTPWTFSGIHERSPDKLFLRRAYTQYVKYEHHLWRNRGGEAEGLFHYSTESTNDPKYDRQAIRFESGWDNSARWDESVNLWTVDMNSYIVQTYRGMERMSRWLSLPEDARRWRAKRVALARKINEHLFDPSSGAYLDRRRDTGEFLPLLTAASMTPLFAGVADRSKAAAMANLASDPRKLFPGMPTVAYDHPKYDSGGYWRGPSWPEISYFAITGLKLYGFRKLAEALRQNLLNWCASSPDALYEYYDSKSGKGLGEPQYGNTAVFLIELIAS